MVQWAHALWRVSPDWHPTPFLNVRLVRHWALTCSGNNASILFWQCTRVLKYAYTHCISNHSSFLLSSTTNFTSILKFFISSDFDIGEIILISWYCFQLSSFFWVSRESNNFSLKSGYKSSLFSISSEENKFLFLISYIHFLNIDVAI